MFDIMLQFHGLRSLKSQLAFSIFLHCTNIYIFLHN